MEIADSGRYNTDPGVNPTMKGSIIRGLTLLHDGYNAGVTFNKLEPCL